MDDRDDEYLLRLEKSLLYKTLVIKCQGRDNDVITLVNAAVSFAFQRTKTIIKHMGEYTLHDGDHLFRVLNIMELLLTEENVNQLSAPELLLLIISAFFHDIGMAPSEQDVLTWKKAWDLFPSFANPEEKVIYNKFNRFLSARPDQQEEIVKLLSQGNVSGADTLKGYLITEFIRQTHAERAREIIAKDWDGKIKFRDNDLTVELAQICYSHNEDALSILELDRNYLCGQGIIACLPMIGMILRLSDILDFDAKRTPAILISHLSVRHPISLAEWNKHRAVEAWQIDPELIQFSAKCTHPAIEAAVHEFCDMIDHELTICNNIASSLNEFNKSRNRDLGLKFPFKVNRDKIRTKTNIQNKPIYIYKETKFNLSKKQVIDLLMGTKLYGNPEVALRELLQNSIDACLLRAAQEERWNNTYLPEITVRYYSEFNEDVLEVIDNGTGMDQYIIDNYYSKVGSSFYKSIDFYSLKSETNANFEPTSRFGIGILSCFMIADTLVVDTRRLYAPHKSSEALNITVEGQESIFWIKEGARETPGTTTRLLLRKSRNPWEKMTEDEFIKSVEQIIPNPPFKINIETTKEKKVIDENSFQTILASSLKDYSWKKNENIDTFEFTLNNQAKGLLGSAIVAVLIKANMPANDIELNSKNIEIEGEAYTLEKKLLLNGKDITQTSSTITITEEGEIKEDSSTQILVNSRSTMSLHGIIVPSTLFPQSWTMKRNQARLDWPLPMAIVIDVSGKADLDLNSARTEVLEGEKWNVFEENLAYEIFSQLAAIVKVSYWNRLKEILLKKAKTENFKIAIERIVVQEEQ